MHRSFQRYRSHKKYFLSSEIQLLKVGRISEISEKSPDPRQDFVSGASKSVHPKNILLCKKYAVTVFCYARYRSSLTRATSYLAGIIVCTYYTVNFFVFFYRDISELKGSRDLIFGRHDLIYLKVCQHFYFLKFWIFSYFFR